MFWGKNALENLKTIENWKTAGNLSKMLNLKEVLFIKFVDTLEFTTKRTHPQVILRDLTSISSVARK